MNLINKIMRRDAPAASRELTFHAVWNGETVARSSRTIALEGNQYFPPGDVVWDRLTPSDRTSFCPWKGSASYLDIEVDGRRNEAAAWTYPEPKAAAEEIRDHVAFWKGVEIAPVD